MSTSALPETIRRSQRKLNLRIVAEMAKALAKRPADSPPTAEELNDLRAKIDEVEATLITS